MPLKCTRTRRAPTGASIVSTVTVSAQRGRAEEGRGGGLVGELGFDGDERNGGGGLLVVAHFSLSADHVPITFPRQEAAIANPLAATR